MNLKKILLIGAISILFAGCSATLPVQSGGGIAKNNGKKVTSNASTINFLGFNPMSLSTADKVITDLQSQCNGGEVTGVTTLASRKFLFIIVKESIEVSGYCAE